MHGRNSIAAAHVQGGVPFFLNLRDKVKWIRSSLWAERLGLGQNSSRNSKVFSTPVPTDMTIIGEHQQIVTRQESSSARE